MMRTGLDLVEFVILDNALVGVFDCRITAEGKTN